jgi:hypothetical protein
LERRGTDTCYLRDIERDYKDFNEERTAFYKEQGLNPLPASTGIQAILCRPDLLVEIEAIAMIRPRDVNGHSTSTQLVRVGLASNRCDEGIGAHRWLSTSDGCRT